LRIEASQRVGVIEKVGAERAAIVNISGREAVLVPRLIVNAIRPLRVRVALGSIWPLKEILRDRAPSCGAVGLWPHLCGDSGAIQIRIGRQIATIV
jgi:hypothetical protein